MMEVWYGPDSLRDLLAPIESLRPTQGNPRRGDVDRIAASLLKFGQRRPVIVEGNVIRAGHHLVLASEQIGWTHVAVDDQQFKDEADAHAFMLADNRTHDSGTYDTEQLTGHLDALAKLDRLDGTGYSLDDIDDLHARLKQQGRTPTMRVPSEQEPPSSLNEVVLLYDDDQLQQFEVWLRIVEKERGTSGASEAVYEALGIVASQLNG